MADFVVGLTGASGSIYGVRLVQELVLKNHHVDLVVTSAGALVMKEEIGVSDKEEIMELIMSFPRKKKGAVKIWANDDFEAPFLSGTSAPEAVIVIPCSMGKLAAIAHGISSNVLERTADVALKEKRKLVLVVRETPLSIIHLENMVRASKAGAHILPAMPAFYHHPKTIDDMVNFVVGKVLNVLGIDHKLFRGWKGR
ncbi:MAG: flavin prenyltransferase UbiX [Nitrospirota bacterium]